MGRKDPTIGLVLVSADVSSATFDAANSTLTQAGPGPGRAEPAESASRWRPQVSGAQDQDLTLQTIRGSFAATSGGARVAYRLGTDEDDEDYRGWCEPNVVVDWTAPTDGWGSAADFDDPVAAVVESTGQIVVTAKNNGDTGGTTWSYDQWTRTWTTLYDWSTGAGGPGLHQPIGLVYDVDNDALILYSGHGSAGNPATVAYRSTDGGSTWAVYSIGCWDDTIASSSKPIRIAAPPNGRDWMALHADQQFASSDNGVTWELVEGGSKGVIHVENRTPLWNGTSFTVISMGDGLGGSETKPASRTLASARSLWSDADSVGIDTALIDNLVATADYDGRVIVYTMGDAGTSLDDQSRCCASVDGGANWFGYTGGVLHGAAGVGPSWSACVAVGGQVHLIGRSATGDADQQGSISVLSLGGWSQIEHGVGVTANYSPRNRIGWGAYYGAASGIEGAPTYLPFDVPDNMGWTPTTSGSPVVSLSGGGPGLETEVAPGDTATWQATASTHASYACGLSVLFVDTADVVANSGIRAAAIRLEAGGYSYLCRIEVGSDSVRVRDNTTTRETAPIPDLTKPIWVAWQVRKGGATVWVRQSPSPVWTRIADDVTLTDLGAGTADSVTFGTVNGSGSVTEIVQWLFVGATFGGDWRYGAPTAESALTSADQVLGLTFGRPIPPPASAYPIPEACTTEPAYLSATGGPTHATEVVELPTAYAYGLGNVYPAEVPRPSKAWRSTDDAAIDLKWDAGSETWWGGGIALAVLNATPRLWVLKEDDGDGGWTTLGTLDLALGTGLKWARIGRTITPASGTTTIDRYIQEDELKGTTFDCDGVPVEILRNGPGYWTDATTKQRVHLTLADPGAAGASGTAGVLCARSGVMPVYHAQVDEPRRKLRLQVAANQPTASGYYSAGVIAVGRVLGLGAPPGWDWSELWTYSREVRRATDGTPTVRKTGTARRTYSSGWTDGLDLFEIGSLARDPDRIAIGTSSASLGTAEDVAWTLPRVLEGALQAGQVPTILIRDLPLVSGTTITDPEDWLYGVLISDSLGVTGVVGDNGQGIVRLDSAAFEEITG